ncbi:MAG TPA: LacI family DNA-binding transcriptional regulator [Verrucomicrobiae bacterium]|nr:LacI family DNA-binding transcriptional regulator [Verrucomicrobiae bacterium]
MRDAAEEAALEGGQRLTRLRDIAERCQVTAMTVSRALRDAPEVSEETRARILECARQLGYLPNSSARELRTRKTKLLGLLLPSLTSPIFSRVALALEERSRQLGYDLVVAQSLDNPEREQESIRRFLTRRMDGIFLTPVYRLGAEAALYQDLAARKIPTVILGHTSPFCRQFVNVETDDLLASYALTSHLLKLGHRRIAWFGGPSVTPWNQERFEGYRRALREAGLEVDEKLVFQAGRTIEDGAKTAVQMMNEGCEATAIQAVNDLVAVGCIEAMMQEGIDVPGNFSVAGFGNILLGQHSRIPLTTARQPKYTLGMAAMGLMEELLAGKQPSSKRLPAEIIVRASSGTPPAVSVS